jgi:hypothetical protein
MVSVGRLGMPLSLACRFAHFSAADLGAEPLVMMIPGIGCEPFFAVTAFFAATFR